MTDPETAYEDFISKTTGLTKDELYTLLGIGERVPSVPKLDTPSEVLAWLESEQEGPI